MLGTCPAPSLIYSCPAHLVCPDPIKAGPAPSAHHLRLEETHRPRTLVGPCPHWLDGHTRVHRHVHTYVPTRKRAQRWLGTGHPGEAARSGPDVASWAACPAWLSFRRWWGPRGPRSHPPAWSGVLKGPSCSWGTGGAGGTEAGSAGGCARGLGAEKMETGGTRGWFLENPRDLPMDPRRSRGKGVRLLAGAARDSWGSVTCEVLAWALGPFSPILAMPPAPVPFGNRLSPWLPSVGRGACNPRLSH